MTPTPTLFSVTAFACVTCLMVATLASQAPSTTPSTPDLQMQAVLDEHAKLGPKPIETLSPNEARKQPSPADAVTALLKSQGKSTAPEPVGNVANRSISGAGAQIPVRIYTPKGTGPFPLLLYIHGGGWVIADLDTYDASARALTNAANVVVVSTHYRQAPEHKFPAAHEDVYAAYRWATANAKSINADPARVAVAGESAGGNMAAYVSIRARDESATMPLHQLLVYPVVSTDTNTPSYQENANAKPLSKAGMQWFFSHYLTNSSEGNDPRIALLKVTNLKGLPSATVITAQIDPLRSEGQMYAERLKDAGVSVSYRNYDGVTHEFFGMGAVVDKAKDAVQFAGTELKKALQGTTQR